jgi:hypothetical protein
MKSDVVGMPRTAMSKQQTSLRLVLTESRAARFKRIVEQAGRPFAPDVNVMFDEANEKRAEEIARADRERDEAARVLRRPA